jgi:hypothetical protein
MRTRRSRLAAAVIWTAASICVKADSSASLLLGGTVAATSSFQASSSPTEAGVAAQGNYASGFTVLVTPSGSGDAASPAPASTADNGTGMITLQAN